jgi:hypothetical protein
MAVDLGSAHGKIDIDLSALKNAGRTVVGPMREVERSAEGVGVTIVRSQQSIERSMDRLKGAINLQQRQYALLKEEVEAVSEEYGIGSTQARKKQLSLDRLTQSIANNEQKLEDLNAELVKNNTAMDSAGAGAGTVSSRFNHLRGGTQNLVGTLGKLSIAAGAIVGVGAAFNRVTEDLNAARLAFGEIEGVNLQTVVEQGNYLSSVYGQDVTESYRTAARVADEFNISAGAAMEILGKGQDLNINRFGDLQDTLNEYSDDFAALGLTAAGTLSVLNEGLQAGFINTDKIGDSLNEFRVNLKDPAVLEAVGKLDAGFASIQQRLASGEISEGEAFQQIIAGLNAIEDPLKRQEIGVLYFRSLWENMGEEAVLALGDSVAAANENGAAIEEMATRYDTWGQLTSAITSKTQAMLAEALGPLSDGLLNLANDVMPRFEERLAAVGRGIDALRTNDWGDAAAEQWLNQRESVLEARDAIRDYEQASAGVQEAVASEAKAVRGLQALLAMELQIRGDLAERGEKDPAIWEANAARILTYEAALEDATADLTAAAGAATATAEATAGVGVQAALTAEEMEALSDAAVRSAENGAQAFGKAVSTERDFLQEREDAQREHQANVADLITTFNEQRAGLAQKLAAATTEEERAQLQQQIVNLEDAQREKLTTAQQSYQEQELAAAESYARQQAAQMAHLGQELINYTVARARRDGVSQEALDAMTADIASQFGVQQSLTDRSFGQMTQSIDEWAAKGGENTDEYIGHLRDVQTSALHTQEVVDAQIKELTEQATEDFRQGKIGPDEYAARLLEIPGEAEAAAEGIRNALAKIPTEIVTTHTTVERVVIDEAATRQIPSEEARGDLTTVAGGGVAGRRAMGGPVGRGLTYLVGEQGPELFRAPADGRIETSTATRAALASLSAASAAGVASAAPMARGSVTLNLGGITMNNPVVDTTARLHELTSTILDQADARLSATLERIVAGGIA